MKVGVLSDTHLSAGRALSSKPDPTAIISDLTSLEAALATHFQEVVAIIHAGDFVDLAVYELLQRFGPVHAVAGNMDGHDLHQKLGSKQIVELGGKRIGLMHGSGGPEGISGRIRAAFTGEQVSAIVFGHSHQPYCQVEDGILMFNPGSPCDRNFAPRRSMGLLYIADDIRGEHIALP